MLSNIIILIGSDVLGHWSVYIYFDNVLERGSICCPGWTWIQLLLEGQCPTLSSVTNQQTHTHTHTSVPISSRRHKDDSQTMYKLISLLAVFGPYVIAGGRFERTISRPFRSLLRVHNGMRWGSWAQKEMCPTGMYATGFSLKVADMWESLLVGDNTALNGIRLHCINPSKSSSGPYEDYATVQSDVGSWGKWSDIKWCSSGFLTTFQLRVEPYKGIMDDTAANNIRFNCSGNTEMLQGSGMSWGEWGEWSETCGGKGICGIETMVEQPQGVGDDTALNDMRMYCCD
ncbi:hypothetical protein cypCar_00020876 [Cyprinus carpio]|uniref:Uncharacterized protein n=1 Tax=Cyprinus carpio carpio TaxID=630221 RepID=A0A9J7XZK5_CYPCA|nr:hypothetical protein cypCar_00020876 [Cyprinus carpio]